MMKAALLALTLFTVGTFAQTSICDKYSVALNTTNYNLVAIVVAETVEAALGSDLKQFFDGTTPAGSTNFTNPANSAKYATLASHLIEFFGSALGCTDGTIEPYSGNPDMKAVHAKMPITPYYFNEFNSALVGVLAKYGVSVDDQNAVKNVLESTRPAICNTDCATTTTTMSSTTSSATAVVASISMAIVFVAALF